MWIQNGHLPELVKGRKGAAVLPGDGGGGARKVQSSGAAVNLRASHRGGPLNPPLMDELLLVVLRRALLHPLDRRDRPDVLRGLYTLITVRAALQRFPLSSFPSPTTTQRHSHRRSLTLTPFHYRL
ncbi:hypothetical protein E2C01_011758 [Portunus trituberculatus]|uniref:Uncharacterized protein n=1 Tax=Portunus trituberculatus TaxID=210409 RepID=A0A5B7DBY3_PORTR|nr:hypothetical protein [Portunus trituberculatus]